MVDSTSDAIITDPQSIIAKLFDAGCGTKSPSATEDYDIPKTFDNAFSDPLQFEKIPRLDELSPTSLQTGSLVRFLGMVQDTSYSQEIYVGMTRDQDKWKFHRYGQTAPVDVDIHSPDTILDERNGVYMTCIPGCARWLEGSSLESLSLEDNTVLRGDKERIVSHGQKEIGVVVKCYSGLENSIRVCDLVEVVGILDMSDHEDEETNVVIHAVTIRKRQLNEIVTAKYGRLSSENIKKAQDLFIQHLSVLFEGDILAAKSILLNLTSSLTHRNPTPLGSLPLNIYSTPAPVATKVTTFIRSVLPAVAVETIAIKSLNEERIYPQSDGEKLSSGRGQFVSRTALVIDESAMHEGKLLDTGVRNLRFLSRVSVAQKLTFEFPYSEFEIDTDIPILVLGDTKTLLPVAVTFPHVKGETSTSVVTPEDSELLRAYLAQVSQVTVSIPETVADEMQTLFVRKRKETGGDGIDETWFGQRIIVAKGLSRIAGRNTVSPEDWQQSLQTCLQWASRSKGNSTE